MPFITSDNVKLYFEEHGQGEPLLLLAGLNCDSCIWTFILPELKAHFRVILLDNRGVGQSDCPDAALTIETMAKDAREVFNHLSIDKAHVLGHSMGGTIAQMIAYKYPDRVHKLVLCSSLVKMNVVNKMLGAAFIFLKSLGLASPQLIEKVMPFLFAKRFRQNKALVQEIIQNFLKNRHPKAPIGFKRQLEALAAFNSTRWLNQIKAPALIIEGDEDLLCAHDSLFMSKIIAGAQLITFSQVGHVPMIEQPKDFNRSIIDFLKL